MTQPTSFDKLNEQIDYVIERNKLDPHSLTTRISVFKELKAKIEEDETDESLKFSMLQMINSEICVLRARQHLAQLRLF